MFRFVYPWILLGIPVFIGLFYLFRDWRGNPALRYPLYAQLPDLFEKKRIPLVKIPAWFSTFAVILLCIGLARPQFGRSQTEVTSEGIDIILSIDTSGSMAAMDFKLEGKSVDRLTVVKKVVTEFIQQQKGDRIGMVVFGDQAFTQCPLTLDYDVLIQLLDHLRIGIAGDGTAIGDGLALAVKRLKDLPGKSRVVILLTDGRNNAGKIAPEKAAEIAKTFNIKVYTIGIGTKGPVPFPQPSAFGTRLIYVNLDMDEGTLKEIADATGGRYFFATDTKKLEAIYAEIGRLEKTKAKVKHFETFDELYGLFVWPGFLGICLDLILGATWLRRLV